VIKLSKLIRTFRWDENEQALYITEGFIAGEGDKYRIDKNGLKMWDGDEGKLGLDLKMDEFTDMMCGFITDSE